MRSSHAVLIQDGSVLAIQYLQVSAAALCPEVPIARNVLNDGDVVRIGDYAMTIVAHRGAMAYEPTMLVRP